MRGVPEAQDMGLWLLARLWLHDRYNRRLREGRQEPLPGLGLSSADRLELARLELELARAAAGGPEEVR